MEGSRITSEERSALSTYIGLGLFTALAVGAIYFIFIAERHKGAIGYDPNRPVPTDEVLRLRLKPEEWAVVRENNTQTPFQNDFWNKDLPGLYVDVITGDPLFSSVDKYDSGLGMPTFSKPIAPDLIAEKPDTSHDMQRTEVRAKRSDAHLGHVFEDPASPSGRRYSVNSAAFHFIPEERLKELGYEKFQSALEKK